MRQPALGFSQPPRNVLCDERDLRFRRQFKRTLRIRRHQRLNGVPVHLRQVVVFRIPAVRHKSFSDRPALIKRQLLQRGGQFEP